MGIVDSITGWLHDVREAHRERQRARRRRREAGVRPGQKVRDGVGDDLLRVVNISDTRSHEYTVNGTALPDYGKNTTLDFETDVVVECQRPGSDDVTAYPASRIVPLEITIGEYARDRFTGDVLTVNRIRDTVAGEWFIDGTPLSEYGVNQNLECADDWVVECVYHYSRGSRTYDFPISRLAPGKYPTAAEEWKNKVVDSKKCYSCGNGWKHREQQSACKSCRGRIFARDDRVCQQKGCDATDNLVIHHLWYRPNPVTETIPDRYLIVLCDDHHRARHGIDE